jgi:NAD(P)H-dependent FMN reductase
MLKIGIIVGSTRPGGKALDVAQWVQSVAAKRRDAIYEVVDIADFELPLLDEPVPPSMGQYSKPHTMAWSERVAEFDGFVIVTPEYNHSTSGALKNALDFLYKEWNNKAAGFVSYGSAGGARAVEHLRAIAAELQMATVRAQVMFYLDRDFKDYTTFTPKPEHEGVLNTMLDQLIPWTQSLESVRTGELAAAR